MREKFEINNNFKVNIFFGIEGYNRKFYTDKGSNLWFDNKIGGPIFDPTFDIKRKDSKHTYIPGVVGNGSPRLYPEERIKSSLGEIKKSELLFLKEEKDNIRWSMFFAIGFLLASWLYHRELKKMIISNGEMIE